MRKIRFKRHMFLSMIAMCATFISCTSSDDISPEVIPTDGSSELTCDVKDKEYDEAESRSSLHLSGGKMVFAWESGDAMTVFAEGDNDAAQIYKLSAGVGEPKARFSTTNFTMTKNKLYFAFGKEINKGSNYNIESQNDIKVNYDGQIQMGNASDNHLGEYDFLAAGILCEDPSNAHFEFSHFGATLRLVIAFDENKIIDAEEKTALNLKEKNSSLSPIYFTELELFDKKNEFIHTQRGFSFANGSTAATADTKASYTFNFANTKVGDRNRFKLRLNNTDPDSIYKGGITRYETFSDNSGDNTAFKLITYMEVPPHSFFYDTDNPENHDPLNFLIKGYYEKKVNDTWVKVPVSYVYEHKKNYVFQSGRAHQISFTADKPEEFKVTLNVNHTWQHGDVLDDTTVSPAKSRALSDDGPTSDPGNDKEIHLPKYIYYIYCHDGKVVLPSYDINAKAVTMINATETSNWSTERREPDHHYISKYVGNDGALNGVVTLTKYKKNEPGHTAHTPNTSSPCTYHLYVVASESKITSLYNSETGATGVSVGQDEENVVRALTYGIPNSNAQVFMRDLYSTPWDETDFEGNLTTKEKDIYLYHVAAKVDVKWNTTTTPINSVSVKSVLDQDLFLFKPTENVYSDGTYSPSKSIDDDDEKYLGRTEFYLPQFKNDNCKYNIGFNSEAATTVTFTPDVTKGYTSWLRWLKKK